MKWVTPQQGVPGDAVPWPEREGGKFGELPGIASFSFSSPAAAGGTRKVPE